MNTQTYIWCAVAGLLGIAIHLFAVKLPSLQTRAKVANMPFKMGEALRDDSMGIIASILTVCVAIVCADELLNLRPAVAEYLKFAFVFIGFTGSSLLIAALGKASGAINSVVDKKTDIADGK